MPEIFISYSRPDSDFAEILRRRITDAGFTSWIDLEELRAGEEWCQAIDQAIRDSIALIVILSSASAKSEYVAYEWAFALGAGVLVVPLLLQPSPLHPRLATLHQLDFTRHEGRPWMRLIDELKAAANARPTHSIRVSRNAPNLVRDAVAALDQPDPQVMEAALRRLAEMNFPEAEAALVDCLQHPLPDVRIGAALQFAERGDLRALPGLFEGNRRRQWRLGFGPILEKIGSPALPALKKELADPKVVEREFLVWAYANIGDAAVVPDLVRLLGDADPKVQRAAAQVLQRFGTPEAVAALEQAIPSFVRDLHEGPERLQNETRQFLEILGTPSALAAVADWKSKQRD